MWRELNPAAVIGIVVLSAIVPAAACVARKLTQARAWNASSGLVGTLGAIGLVPFIKPGLEPEYWYQDPTPYLLGVVVGASVGVMSTHTGRAREWLRHRAFFRTLENRAPRPGPSSKRMSPSPLGSIPIDRDPITIVKTGEEYDRRYPLLAESVMIAPTVKASHGTFPVEK